MKWPPPYTLRRSRRARNISLQIDPVKGLELVLPHRVDLNEALVFLDSRRSWIEKHAGVIENSFEDPNCKYDMPAGIALRALEKSFNLRFHFLPKSKSIVLRALDDRLILTGNITDFRSCAPYIKNWMQKQARDFFSTALRETSQEISLPFNKLSVRGQKTLWGSCSPERNISLNYKLLFLPYEMVRYVFIHELCHTVHLNHSKRFWALVKHHLPDYKNFERELRRADQFIPKWFLAT